MIYRVTHITDYIYEAPASLCHNIMVQVPRDLDFQQVRYFEYQINPQPSYTVDREDFFENKNVYFSIEKTHKKLTVTAKSEIVLTTPAWQHIDPKTTPSWEEVAKWLKSTEALNDIRQYYLESKHVDFVPGIREYALKSFTPNRPIMEAMLELNERIFNDFKFTPGFTDISTPLSKVFESKKGVCQDFAHFSLACLRSLGLQLAMLVAI